MNLQKEIEKIFYGHITKIEKKQILSAVKEYVEEVIGEDEKEPQTIYETEEAFRNQLRKQQLNKLKELLK